MIVQDSAGSYFKVRDAGDEALSHVWIGTQMRKKKQVVGIPGVPGFSRTETVFVPKTGAREILVRKIGCEVVQ